MTSIVVKRPWLKIYIGTSSYDASSGEIIFQLQNIINNHFVLEPEAGHFFQLPNSYLRSYEKDGLCYVTQQDLWLELMEM